MLAFYDTGTPTNSSSPPGRQFGMRTHYQKAEACQSLIAGFKVDQIVSMVDPKSIFPKLMKQF